MAKRKNRKYTEFAENNNLFMAVEKVQTSIPRLPAGVYDLKYDTNTGRIFYDMLDTNHDELLDLPSPEFKTVVKQIETFLTPQTKILFNEYGFLYKRSALLHGVPGTGKTCIVNRVSDYVVKKKEGIVLFNPNPGLLIEAITQINDVQPNTPVLVIFEELDKLMRNHEGELLSILDGEIQKANIIYLATTNFYNMIPPRIRRPGRFSNIIEVGFPGAEVREYYLNTKIKDSRANIKAWVELTDGFSIDELKETVLAVKCLNEDLKETVNRIKEIKSNTKNDPRDGSDDPYSEDKYVDLESIQDWRKSPPSKPSRGRN